MNNALLSSLLASGSSTTAVPTTTEITLVGYNTTSVIDTTAPSVSLTALTGGIASSAAAGDLVLVFINSSQNSAAWGSRTITSSGYTTEIDNFLSSSTYSSYLTFGYKFMGATPDTTVTCSALAAANRAQIVHVRVYRNVASVAMDTTRVVTGSTGTAVDPPAIAPTTVGYMVVAGGGINVPPGGSPAFSTTDLSNFISIHVNQPGGLSAVSAWGDSGTTINPAAFTRTSISTSVEYSQISVTVALRPQTPGTAIPTIAVALQTTPFIAAYTWSSATGLGTKYTDPTTLPAGQGTGIAFSPAGDAIAISHATTPFITTYPWSSIAGFGTKYTNPATLPTGIGNGVAFNPAGDTLAIAHTTSPAVSAYPWSRATGFGTKYTNPGTIPAGTGSGVAFSPAGDAIAVAHQSTPFISVYPWGSITGFGTRYTSPATLPLGVSQGTAFNTVGDAIAVSHSTTPFISIYPWSSATGFGTKYTNPATLPAGSGRSVAFSPDGDAIAIAHNTTPFTAAYPWSSATGFGTKYANPDTLPASTGIGIAFTNTSDAVAIGHANTPFITAYPWSSSTGYGTKYTNPAALPTSAGFGVAFSPTRKAISFVTSASSANSAAITIPATAAAGDIAFISSGSTTGSNPAIPTGWTQVSQTIGGLFTFRILYKILTVSDIGATLTVGGPANAGSYAGNTVLIFKPNYSVSSVVISSLNADGEVNTLPTRTKNTATYPAPDIIIASRFSFNQNYFSFGAAIAGNFWNGSIIANSSLSGLATGYEIQNLVNTDRAITIGNPATSYEHLHSFVVNLN